MTETEEIHYEGDEEELIDLIRDTVDQLNNLGDRLEVYAKRKSTKPPLEVHDGG